MKKYSSILIIILVTGLFANAQSKATKKADKLFSKFEFVDAAKAYEALIAKRKLMPMFTENLQRLIIMFSILLKQKNGMQKHLNLLKLQKRFTSMHKC